MTGSIDFQTVNVVPLRTATRVVWETERELRGAFFGWHIWYSTWSASWNAHREDRDPYFGPVPDGAPIFMVSTSSAAHLVALLECQTLGDMTREFPGWRIGRTATGDWYAVTRSQYGVRLVQSPDAVALGETVRAVVQRWRHHSAGHYADLPVGDQRRVMRGRPV